MHVPEDLPAAFAAFVRRTTAPPLPHGDEARGRPRGVQHLMLWDERAKEWLFPTEATAPRLHEINERGLASSDLKTWAFVLTRELREAGWSAPAKQYVELRHHLDTRRAATVYYAVGEGWRLAPFVAQIGSTGHSTYPSLFGALYAALRLGYLCPEPGAVDRLFVR